MQNILTTKMYRTLVATILTVTLASPLSATELGGLGASVGASAGNGGTSASASASVGNTSASANVGVGHGSGSVGANVSTGNNPGVASNRSVSRARNLNSRDNAARGIAASELVGMVVMSADGKVLGIVQDANRDSAGYVLNIQLYSGLNFDRPAIAIKMPQVTPRNDRIRLGLTMARLRALQI